MTFSKQFLISVCFLSVNFGVSAENQRSTLEGCADLLPNGHNYEVVIKLQVDKASEKTNFNGDLSVEGDTDDSQNFNIGKFVECVAPLIKNIKD